MTDKTPSLAMLDAAFGDGASVDWMMAQLENLSEFCGCLNKFSVDQQEETGALISAHYPYLKVSELLLFFGWLKLGMYGKFYGSLDPIVVTEALRTFVAQRNVKLHKIEIEESNKCRVPYEEWKRRTDKLKEEARLKRLQTKEQNKKNQKK